jgi:hypothetical protein
MMAEKEKKLGGCTGKGFMPGQSGNPGGVPKNKWLSDVTEEMLEEKLKDPKFREQYKDSLWKKLLAQGVVSAMTLDKIWERTEGKVTQTVDVNGTLNITISERMRKAKERKLNHNG